MVFIRSPMPDENNPKPNPEDVQVQMRAAVERIRKTFNLMLNQEPDSEENEKASGASAGTDSKS
jgi:hypothetical protein